MSTHYFTLFFYLISTFCFPCSLPMGHLSQEALFVIVNRFLSPGPDKDIFFTLLVSRLSPCTNILVLFPFHSYRRPCGEMASRLTTTQCDQEIAGSTPVSVIFFRLLSVGNI